jgi:hypothetical protein
MDLDDALEVFDAGDAIDATPAGLSVWLRGHDTGEWPKTYEALRAIGLDRWVIEWLQIVAEKLVSPPPEEVAVVLAFLAALASDTVYAEVTPTSAPLRQSKTVGKRAQAPTSVSQVHAPNVRHAELVARIVAALQGVTATQWPDQLFDLDLAAP